MTFFCLFQYFGVIFSWVGGVGGLFSPFFWVLGPCFQFWEIYGDWVDVLFLLFFFAFFSILWLFLIEWVLGVAFFDCLFVLGFFFIIWRPVTIEWMVFFFFMWHFFIYISRWPFYSPALYNSEELLGKFRIHLSSFINRLFSPFFSVSLPLFF